MRTIVLSLTTATERREYMSRILSEQDIMFTFLDSFTHKDVDFKKLNFGISSPQAVANFHTHREAISRVKDEWTLILEDDATPTVNVLEKINHLLSIRQDFDILFIGWYGIFMNNSYVKDGEFLHLKRFIGTHSYIINPNSRDKILQNLGLPTNHIDHRMSQLVREKKINGLFVKDVLFNQNKKFKSQIPK